MAGENLVLVAGTYPDGRDAADDFQALKDGAEAGDYALTGAVLVHRDLGGEVTVEEHGAHEVGAGVTLGAVGGFVLGLFAPPLLLATAFGAGIGAGIGKLVKRHEAKEMGVDVEEFLPPSSSAVVAIVELDHAERVEGVLGQAEKTVAKPIDCADYDQIEEAIGAAAGTTRS